MKSQSTCFKQQDVILRTRLRKVNCFFDNGCRIRLVSLAAQRYITEVISKSLEYNKLSQGHSTSQSVGSDVLFSVRETVRKTTHLY